MTETSLDIVSGRPDRQLLFFSFLKHLLGCELEFLESKNYEATCHILFDGRKNSFRQRFDEFFKNLT